MAPSTSTSITIPYSHHDSRGLLSLEDQGNTISILSKVKHRPQIPIPGVQILDDRRRSLLGPRDAIKRLSGHLNFESIYTTTSTTSITSNSLNQVYNKKQSLSANNLLTRHSIAIVPMASKPSTINTTAKAPKTPPLQISTDIDVPDDQSSICHSPTWENDKSKKRNSGWAWRKSSFSKLRKEEEMEQMQAATKTVRKLNKKPPPAMETQRQSATLASPAIRTESPPTVHRRPSSSGSLTQAVRGFLSRRSSHTITPETSRPASVQALRSQSQERKARELYQKASVENGPCEEDEMNADDIASFVDEIEASAKAAIDRSELNSSAQDTTFPAAIHTPPHSRGQEAANTTSSQRSLPIATRETSVPTSRMSRIFGKKDNAAGGYKYPGLNTKSGKTKAANEHAKTTSTTWLNRNFGPKTPTDVVPQKSGSSLQQGGGGGGGYVQRQRSIHHQRSMLGFRDEMAVKSAYDQFLTESQLPPTPKDSSESVHDETRTQINQQSRVEVETANHHNQLVQPPTPPPKTTTTHKQTSQSPEKRLTVQPVRQTQAVQVRNARPLPATPVESEGRKLFKLSRSTRNEIRPAPTTIQSPTHDNLLFNSPHHNQSHSDKQQFKNSSATINSSSTGTSSTSSVATQQMSPVYQLPALVTSKTSPAFSGKSGRGTSPPVLNLSDSNLRLVPTKSQIEMPPPPRPTNRSELLVVSENVDGIIRNASLKKHRSHPELKTSELKDQQANTKLPSLDFLPELKHQSFTKPKRSSRAVFAPGSPNQPPLSPSQFPLPSSPNEIVRRGDNQIRISKRTSVIPNGPPNGKSSMSTKQIAKLFVICCHCGYWHDLPSKIYEAMALPQSASQEGNLTPGIENRSEVDQEVSADGEVTGLQGRIFTQVKCPWCPHFLSTSCCQGWTAIVKLHERHH